MDSVTALLLVFLSVVSLKIGASEIVLYSNSIKEPLAISDKNCESGAVFSENTDFTCVCVTGLWAFYEGSCEQAKVLIGGSNGQCVPIYFKVFKANRLSPAKGDAASSSATVFDREMITIGETFANTGDIHYIPPGFPVVVTTGEQSWRLPTYKKCLKPPHKFNGTHFFCVFDHKIDVDYRLDDASCLSDDEIIAPFKCTLYMQEHEIDPSLCTKKRRHRSRREARRRPAGRAFLTAIQELRDTPANKMNVTDEDENSNMNSIEQPIINSELWNYMTLRAQERLGIREHHSPTADDIYSPSLLFLNLAKKIQQKTCPDYYVGDAHYDVAVGAFIAIQRNYFRYTDAFVDFASSERIEEALNACLANISEPYPFLERVGDRNMSVECNDSKPITHGSYIKFNELLELNVRSDLASRNNEPIVETVWKVFVHAHSACYPFFKDNYNDHHRFTTIMLSLFTNDINDLWFNITEVHPDIYSGFLGDAIELMDSVAYCSLYSRLESQYPWDLPRPKKNNARRKREVEQEELDSYSYQCLRDLDARNVCRKNSEFYIEEGYAENFENEVKNDDYHDTTAEAIVGLIGGGTQD